ncbi:uroporphyrinogen decarboxylase family protein [Sporomusa termitida]|uniref:Uroporphyrinogen decarboxylase n=1 Tax=Sporomusa termitida TaxID=2377 RepID=A0A517DWP8_9FIRM|nr:uroporphyrinogen decarboxylase family protein [Sporomusa termitida]QDR81767.1 Uroporphyrinogen decarboxylase [Sporomusa termitida]
MGQDVMTAEERLVAAINLQPVDRVVCAPLIDQYAGQFAGITNKEFLWDWDKGIRAIDKLQEAYPIWDSNAFMQHTRCGQVGKVVGSMRCKYPGVELKDNAQYQMLEFEAMTRDEYALIKEKGFMEYRLTFLERAHQKSREEVLAGFQELAKYRQLELEATYRRGQSPTWGAFCPVLPFDCFSMMRSIEKFFKDMFQLRDQLAEPLRLANDAIVEAAEKNVAATGVNRVFIGGVRGAGQFISLKQFEKYVWPYLQVMVEKLAERNIIPILHFDADWTNNLEYFLDLPKGKFVLELDGATDIFKTHAILKGHCAIKGDVQAALFTVASPVEVEEYAKKLLTTFRNGEGLLYSSGCSLPMNAKHENVKAFFDAVEKYGRYN